MNLLSIFAWTVFAAETIVSPLPDTVATAGPPKYETAFGHLISPLPDTGQVLGDNTIITPTPSPIAPTISPTPTPTLVPTLTPSPTITPQPMHARKNAYSIALLGDSMIDTLGPGIPDLNTSLASTFPGVHFTLLNYGVGGTNVEYGLQRIANSYEYLGKQIPSLVSTHPDVVVVESFAYNPLPDPNDGINQHWLDLAKIVDALRSNLPGVKIVIAATIAPNATVFGDGAPGINFTQQDKWQRVDVIKKYLESTVAFAQSQHLPLADAFHPSLGSDRNGNLSYINAGDHIHTSPAGRAFFARILTEAITANHLLE